MSRIVKGGLIQLSNVKSEGTVREITQAMLEKTLPYVDKRREGGRPDPLPAGDLQRALLLPVAGPALVRRRRGGARPDGRAAAAEYAKKYKMAMVVPVYEREMAGVYYNTAAVIDADGKYLGKYRKNHIPQTNGFWEKYFFKPGQPRLPGVPDAATRKVGVYICYDRHFPEGARLLGLQRRRDRLQPVGHGRRPLAVPVEARAAGARGRQRLLHGAINRVGTEAPWNIGKFYGTRYFVDPRGNFLADGERGQGRARRRRPGPRR